MIMNFINNLVIYIKGDQTRFIFRNTLNNVKMFSKNFTIFTEYDKNEQ